MVVAATSGDEVLCNCAVCDPKRCDCGCLEAAAERVKRQDDILSIDDETVPAPPPAKESSDVVSPRGRGRPQGPRFALNRPGPRQNRRNQQVGFVWAIGVRLSEVYLLGYFASIMR